MACFIVHKVEIDVTAIPVHRFIKCVVRDQDKTKTILPLIEINLKMRKNNRTAERKVNIFEARKSTLSRILEPRCGKIKSYETKSHKFATERMSLWPDGVSSVSNSQNWQYVEVSGMKCEICQLQEKKYRCPRCSLVYCSLNCYKAHGEQCQKRAEEKSIADLLGNSSQLLSKRDQEPGDDKDLEEVGDKVKPELLEQLAESEQLYKVLENKHLRDYLLQLDNSTNPSQDMENAMKEPIFLEFADECLKIVDNTDNSSSA